jgi:hypothetical protein
MCRVNIKNTCEERIEYAIILAQGNGRFPHLPNVPNEVQGSKMSNANAADVIQQTNKVNLEISFANCEYMVYLYIYKIQNDCFISYRGKADRAITEEQYNAIKAMPQAWRNTSHGMEWVGLILDEYDVFMDEYWNIKEYFALFQIGNVKQVLGIGRSMGEARDDAKQWFDEDTGIIQLTSTDDLKGRVVGDSAIAPCTKALYDKVKSDGKVCDIATKNGIVCIKSEL